MKRPLSTSGESTLSSTPSKKSRVRLSIAEKRKVIQMLKSGSTVLMVAKKFNIGPQTVRDIKKKEFELDKYEINFSSPTSSRMSLRLSNTEHIDQATYPWPWCLLLSTNIATTKKFFTKTRYFP